MTGRSVQCDPRQKPGTEGFEDDGVKYHGASPEALALLISRSHRNEAELRENFLPNPSELVAVTQVY